MEETITKNEKEELMEEEVNVYAKGCGDPRHVCKSDCFIGGGAFINPLE